MKRNGILCILIAAALLVTSLAAVSADQSSTIGQMAMQTNNNAIGWTAGDNATIGSQTINSMNVQAQSAAVTQTGDTIVAGGDIDGSNITLGCGCGENQTSAITQIIYQFNNNSLSFDVVDNATVGDQMINSMNVQAQSAEVTQIGNTIMAVGDIEDSNIYEGAVTPGPTPSPTPSPSPGPAPRPGAGPAPRP